MTPRDVTRYFMTISEAAELVIQAGAMTIAQRKSGQAAPVYLLDMGEPIKIYDLARHMIELSGLKIYDAATGDGDVEIQITGLQPGEKLCEELRVGGAASASSHPKIKLADEAFLPWSELEKDVTGLRHAIDNMDHQKATGILAKLVDGFVGSASNGWAPVRATPQRQFL